jgi:hypothetical protein
MPRRLIIALATAAFMACAHSDFMTRPAETEAVVHLRVIVSSEAAYSANNGWYFDSPACLLDATKCLPTYPVSGPPFLTPEFPGPPPGYRAAFHPGPRAPATALGPTMSRSSLESYAYVLEPTRPGARWFCADNRPTLCYAERPLPMTESGRCPKACKNILP